MSSRFEHYATVESRSRAGVTYEVSRDAETDLLSCSCPAWRFQHLPTNERTCKHTLALMADRRAAAERHERPRFAPSRHREPIREAELVDVLAMVERSRAGR